MLSWPSSASTHPPVGSCASCDPPLKSLGAEHGPGSSSRAAGAGTLTASKPWGPLWCDRLEHEARSPNAARTGHLQVHAPWLHIFNEFLMPPQQLKKPALSKVIKQLTGKCRGLLKHILTTRVHHSKTPFQQSRSGLLLLTGAASYHLTQSCAAFCLELLLSSHPTSLCAALDWCC